jgi:epsilon-lactone hydrolase
MNKMIHQSRIDFEKLGENYAKADGVLVEKEVIENIDCYWFVNKEKSETSRIVIYFHGGCYVLGSIRSHQALVSQLS